MRHNPATTTPATNAKNPMAKPLLNETSVKG
jgi:hypothetical protein